MKTKKISLYAIIRQQDIAAGPPESERIVKECSQIGHICDVVFLSLNKGFGLLICKGILILLRFSGILRTLNAGFPGNQEFHSLVRDSLVEEFVRR